VEEGQPNSLTKFAGHDEGSKPASASQPEPILSLFHIFYHKESRTLKWSRGSADSVNI